MLVLRVNFITDAIHNYAQGHIQDHVGGGADFEKIGGEESYPLKN